MNSTSSLNSKVEITRSMNPMKAGLGISPFISYRSKPSSIAKNSKKGYLELTVNFKDIKLGFNRRRANKKPFLNS